MHFLGISLFFVFGQIVKGAYNPPSTKDKLLFFPQRNTEQVVPLLYASVLLLENNCNNFCSFSFSRLNTLSFFHLSCVTWIISMDHILVVSSSMTLEGTQCPSEMALGTDYNFLFIYPFNILLKKRKIYFPFPNLLKTF